MDLDGAGDFWMHLDDCIVGADADHFVFDGNLAFVDIDLVHFFQYIGYILAGDGAEETSAIADLHRNGDLDLGKLGGHELCFIGGLLFLAGGRGCLGFGYIDIGRIGGDGIFLRQQEVPSIAFGNLDDITFFADFFNLYSISSKTTI